MEYLVSACGVMGLEIESRQVVVFLDEKNKLSGSVQLRGHPARARVEVALAHQP
jgi:hypothetical protein